MKTGMRLVVREIVENDIEQIANYWLTSKPEFLTSMGVDLKKLPSREMLFTSLTGQINSDYRFKDSYALIWEIDGKSVGHSNVNKIIFGNEAYMHLHLWHNEFRRKGIGSELLKKSLQFYFENLQLQTLYSEPYAINQAPNKTLEKIGFKFEKRYTTIPGSINFEQEVNRWALTKTQFELLP
jgi:RimJ/RimL family protein N-acetyltransferase